MKKQPHGKDRAEEPAVIGISGSARVEPAPRMVAFVWADENDLDAVLTGASTATA
jgi:hypothetical protein